MAGATHIEISVNGRTHRVSADATVAAALLDLGIACRQSVTGEPRTPLCGMGICFECRVSIDDVREQRACLVRVREGMRVRTGEDRA